jgi:hypothetical protein
VEHHVTFTRTATTTQDNVNVSPFGKILLGVWLETGHANVAAIDVFMELLLPMDRVARVKLDGRKQSLA